MSSCSPTVFLTLAWAGGLLAGYLEHWHRAICCLSSAGHWRVELDAPGFEVDTSLRSPMDVDVLGTVRYLKPWEHSRTY